jgi:hypothetical protein
MRPITVTVGPLAAASANNICTSQTPTNQFSLNGTLATAAATFTASITGNVMTVTAMTSGTIQLGQQVEALGVPANTYVIGPPAPFTPGQATLVGGAAGGIGGTGAYVLSTNSTVGSTTLYTNAVATLDTARRVLFTPVANETGKNVTLTGTDATGLPITEVLALGNATATYTNLDFKTVTSILISSAAAGAITVGTNGVASSPWVRFDENANSQVSIQLTATGTVNYTLQQTLQSANSPTNPVLPYQVTFLNSTDLAVVNATASVQSNYAYNPALARITLNSGTGSISGVFLQSGFVAY